MQQTTDIQNQFLQRLDHLIYVYGKHWKIMNQGGQRLWLRAFSTTLADCEDTGCIERAMKMIDKAKIKLPDTLQEA